MQIEQVLELIGQYQITEIKESSLFLQMRDKIIITHKETGEKVEGQFLYGDPSKDKFQRYCKVKLSEDLNIYLNYDIDAEDQLDGEMFLFAEYQGNILGVSDIEDPFLVQNYEIPTGLSQQYAKLLLTQQQKGMITIQPKNALIVRGPAGSGKSTVAVWRCFKQLLDSFERYSNGDNSEKLLLVTFTNELVRALEGQKSTLINTLYENGTINIEQKSYIESRWHIRNVDSIVRNFSERYEVKDPELYMFFKEVPNRGPIFTHLNESNRNHIEILERIGSREKRLLKVTTRGDYYIPAQLRGNFSNEIRKYRSNGGLSHKLFEMDRERRQRQYDAILTNVRKEVEVTNKFVASQPNRFFELLFEYIIIQKGMDKEYFLKDFVFHNMHNQFNQSDREAIWTVFEGFKKRLENHNKHLSYAYHAVCSIDKILDRDIYDYIVVDEAQDMGVGKTEFLINLVKKDELGHMPGLSIFVDSAQTIFNPLFSAEKIMPVSLQEEVKDKEITNYTYRELKTIFRNHPSIAAMAEMLKKKAHRKFVRGNHAIKLDVNFADVIEKVTQPNSDAKRLTLYNKKDDMAGASTVFGYKGSEDDTIFFENIHLPKFLKDELNFIKDTLASVYEMENKKINKIFWEVSKKCAQEGTVEARKVIRDLVSDTDQQRYLISSLGVFDTFICILYVAITRARKKFIYSVSERDNSLGGDIQEIVGELLRES